MRTMRAVMLGPMGRWYFKFPCCGRQLRFDYGQTEGVRRCPVCGTLYAVALDPESGDVTFTEKGGER